MTGYDPFVEPARIKALERQAEKPVDINPLGLLDEYDSLWGAKDMGVAGLVACGLSLTCLLDWSVEGMPVLMGFLMAVSMLCFFLSGRLSHNGKQVVAAQEEIAAHRLPATPLREELEAISELLASWTPEEREPYRDYWQSLCAAAASPSDEAKEKLEEAHGLLFRTGQAYKNLAAGRCDEAVLELEARAAAYRLAILEGTHPELE